MLLPPCSTGLGAQTRMALLALLALVVIAWLAMALKLASTVQSALMAWVV